jgi:hypothetical protein
VGRRLGCVYFSISERPPALVTYPSAASPLRQSLIYRSLVCVVFPYAVMAYGPEMRPGAKVPITIMFAYNRQITRPFKVRGARGQ